MSIPEYYKTASRRRRSAFIALSGLAIAAMGRAAESAFSSRWTAAGGWTAVVLLTITGCVAALFLPMQREPCMKCGKPLGSVTTRRGLWNAPAPRCPCCGVRFAERRES